jgi:hypothetical protein
MGINFLDLNWREFSFSLVFALGFYNKFMVIALKLCKCVTKTTIIFQLMYNVHTCDHAMCPHFHHWLWDTNFQLWFHWYN